MPADHALADAVAAFCDAVTPRLSELAAGVDGVDLPLLAGDVVDDAYALAAAFVDADGLHTEAELAAIIDAFAGRTGSRLPARRASVEELRSSGSVLGARSFLDEPSELFEVMLAADVRNGTALASLYYDRAMAIAFTVASLDELAAPVELAAVESYRGLLLDRIGSVRAPLTSAGGGRADGPRGTAPDPNERGPIVDGSRASESTSSDPPMRSVDEVLAELDALVGLRSVKQEVKQVAALTRVQQLRADRGLPVVSQSRHLVFSGNPGTGKTTVARLLAEIYRALGVVSRGHLVEVDRAGLVAGFVGQTATKVTAVFDDADGGLLLIDEAYALVRGSESDFGREAIDTIVKLVEDRRDRIVVIMAGYPDEMRELVDANPGLESRFPKTIHFPDYDTDELVDIFEMHCTKGGYLPSDDAVQAVRILLSTAARTKGFGNGRVARNLFEEAVTRQATRLSATEEPTVEELCTLIAADVPPAGFDGHDGRADEPGTGR